MLSFNSDPKLKKKYIARAVKHRKADDFIQQYGYYKGGKGCAIGCSAETNDNAHSKLEKDTCIPAILFHLADAIFEKLPAPDYKTWTEEFWKAIPEGVDLEASGIWDKFALFLLADKEHGVLQYAKNDRDRAATQAVIDCYQRKINGEEVTKAEWIKVYNEASASASAYAYASASAYAYASASASASAYAYASASAYAYASASASASAYAYAYASASAHAHAKACATYLLELLRAAGKSL